MQLQTFQRVHPPSDRTQRRSSGPVHQFHWSLCRTDGCLEYCFRHNRLSVMTKDSDKDEYYSVCVTMTTLPPAILCQLTHLFSHEDGEQIRFTKTTHCVYSLLKDHVFFILSFFSSQISIFLCIYCNCCININFPPSLYPKCFVPLGARK